MGATAAVRGYSKWDRETVEKYAIIYTRYTYPHIKERKTAVPLFHNLAPDLGTTSPCLPVSLSNPNSL